MKQAVRVHLSPVLFEPDEIRGGLAVIIDVLRASTTIAYSLAAGAVGVVPCEEVEDALAVAARGGDILLGGERGGLKIDGFHLGNSPGEYTAAAVAGRTIAFTTTNGTRALKRAGMAGRIVVGSLVNLAATVRTAAEAWTPVHLVCAGVRGAVCMEDVLAAGAMASALAYRGGFELVDDSAVLAAAAWDRVGREPAAVLAALHRSRGGRNLARVGLVGDVEVAARIDSVDVVPELARGVLVPARS